MKKFKFNWGWGIAIFYTGFLIFILGKVLIVSQLEYNLVTEDYYQKGIEYQLQIDRINRTGKLTKSVTWNYIPQTQIVRFDYPSHTISGRILFYRPSSSRMDRFITIQSGNDSTQIFDTRSLIKGNWKIKVDWQMNDELYYNEGSVDIK